MSAPMYQQPPPGYGPPSAPTNGMAIASLVCGVLGLAVGITFIPAIICGHSSIKQIKQTGEGGRGLAVAGLVLGYLVFALFLLLVVALVVIAVLGREATTTFEQIGTSIGGIDP